MSTIAILIIVALYFVPTIAAYNTKGFNGIAVLNLFLGWSVIGWIAALIWAVQSPKIK